MPDTIFEEKIHKILTKGKGPKVMLFDQSTSQILGNLIPHSKFLDHDFFLFDYITNKSRKKMSEITCFIVIKPTNYQLVIEELKSPFYDDYILLFTNYVPENIIIDLAQNDVRSCVRGVYEIYIDLFRQDHNLYSIYSQNCHYKSGISEFKSVCDGIFSFFRTIDMAPEIYVQKDSNFTKMIGTELSVRFTECKLRNDSKLIILDRKFDLISPLTYTWTYQSMINEFLDYSNGLVNLNNKTYTLDSDLFDNIKFKDLSTVATDLKSFIKNEGKKVSDGLIKNIEDNAKKSDMAEHHLDIYNCIIKDCMVNKELSEIEFDIIKNKKYKIDGLIRIIQDRSIEYEKRYKLLLIYLLKNHFNFDLLESNDLRVQSSISYCNDFKDRLVQFKHKYLSDKNYNRVTGSFKENVDIKLAYEPGIKKIVKDAINNKVSRILACIKQNEKTTKNIIIYVHGGLTYYEYKTVIEYVQRKKLLIKNVQVHLLTDSMITYRDLLQYNK